MIPTEKERVNDAFETIGNLESYMTTWERDCALLLKTCEDKLKDKATPQPERDHITRKVLPALKAFQKHVVAAKTAAAAAIDHSSDASLDKYADAHAFGQAVGAATHTLLAAAGAAVAPLTAALPLGGKPYLNNDPRMKELLNIQKTFLQDFPHFTAAVTKLSAPPAAAKTAPPRPTSAAPAKPAAPTPPPRPGTPAPKRP